MIKIMTTSQFRAVLVSILTLSVTSTIIYLVNQRDLVIYFTRSELNQDQISPLLQGSLLERAVYFERQDWLQRECSSYRRRENALALNASHYTPEAIWSNKELLDHIIVDEKHNLLYCYVPKVACTNWKRTLLFLSGQSNATRPLDIPADLVHRTGIFPKLANYSVSEAAHMLQTYTTFLLVRHPLERLLSAYRNKLEQHYTSSKYFQMRIGRHIVKTYRKHPSNHSLEYGDDVTFTEFVTYLTSEAGPGGEYNEHWKPVHQLCAPCAIRYDVIGKYETLYEDADFLLHQLGESPALFPRFARPSNTTVTLGKYFETLSVDQIRKLHSIYEVDFRLFGYDLQEFLGFEVD